MPRHRTVDTPSIVRRALEDSGGDLAVFALRAAKHSNTVERWLSGASNPSVRTLSDAIVRNGLDPETYSLPRPALEAITKEPSFDELLAALSRIEAKLDALSTRYNADRETARRRQR